MKLEGLKSQIRRVTLYEDFIAINLKTDVATGGIFDIHASLWVVTDVKLFDKSLNGIRLHPLELGQLFKFNYNDYFMYGAIRFWLPKGDYIGLVQGKFYDLIEE